MLVFRDEDDALGCCGGGGGGMEGGNGGGGIEGGEFVDREDVDEWDDEELLVLDLVERRVRLNWLNKEVIAWFCWLFMMLAEFVRVEIADEVASGWIMCGGDIDFVMLLDVLLEAEVRLCNKIDCFVSQGGL